MRAGLSSVYDTKGWVASDVHSEAGSRTLDYACMSPLLLCGAAFDLRIDDDFAVATLATLLNKSADTTRFTSRALSAPFTIYNNATGFMEARNANGSWAGPDAGWTEGDKWAYTFDVVHDVNGLISRRGGNRSFVQFLDNHFDGGTSRPTSGPLSLISR